MKNAENNGFGTDKQIEIMNELLKNTTNFHLKDLIRKVNKLMSGGINDLKPRTEQKLYNFVKYIEKKNFDISGWGICEIPNLHAIVFYLALSQKASPLKAVMNGKKG